MLGRELVDARNARGMQHLALTRMRRAHQQVVFQAAIEQHRVLRHMADRAAQIHGVDLARIDAIDQHRTVGGLVQAQHQFFQRGLARAYAAYDAHALAGLHGKAHAREAGLRAARIVEADIAELDGAAQVGPRDELGVGRMLDRHLHIVVYRVQRRARIVELHHQPGHLAERCQAAPRNHRRRDDAAHRQRRVLHLVHAYDHHGDAHQLLHGLHEVHRSRRNELDLAAHVGKVLGRAFPQALHAALGVERLEGFEIGQRFDQQGIALRRRLEGLEREAFHARLRPERHQQDRGDRHQRWQQHPGRNPDQRQQEQQHERQVHQRGQAGRGNEVAHRLERAQVGRERAHRRRPAFHAQVQHALHDLRRQLHIDALACRIDDIGARRGQHEIEDQHQRDAYGQHPHRLHRIVGHDAVIDIHAEQGHGQREDVDQHRGQQRVAVQAPVVEHHGPEPVAAARLQALLHRTLLELELRAHEAHQSSVVAVQGLAVNFDRTVALGVLQQKAAFGQRAQQQAGTVAVED